MKKLRLKKRVKLWLIYIGISIMMAFAIGIIYVCLTSGNDVKKLNECLQKHDLNYCNEEVK